jgi:menaquinone-dependent protoporphyrinogen oxidase
VRILVVYGTTEGQTRKIAEHVSQHLREGGHEVGLYDSAQGLGKLEITDFGAAVIVASIHQQAHQESVTNFVRAHLGQLQTRPTLFLSVSLSAAFEETKPEAKTYVNRFLANTGWQPTRICLVAGALRHTNYDYFEEQIVEHIVLKGREVGEPGRDQELTDWEGLSRDVEAFMRSLGE